jgi:hypothetical protein
MLPRREQRANNLQKKETGDTDLSAIGAPESQRLI